MILLLHRTPVHAFCIHNQQACQEVLGITDALLLLLPEQLSSVADGWSTAEKHNTNCCCNSIIPVYICIAQGFMTLTSTTAVRDHCHHQQHQCKQWQSPLVKLAYHKNMQYDPC
jgi:hypothetical protein